MSAALVDRELQHRKERRQPLAERQRQRKERQGLLSVGANLIGPADRDRVGPDLREAVQMGEKAVNGRRKAVMKAGPPQCTPTRSRHRPRLCPPAIAAARR